MTAIATRRFTESSDSLLRFGLRLDAVCTGLCGVIGLFVAPRLASLSGLSTTTEYVIAAGFVLYGLVVYMLAALHAVRVPGSASSSPISHSPSVRYWPCCPVFRR